MKNIILSITALLFIFVTNNVAYADTRSFSTKDIKIETELHNEFSYKGKAYQWSDLNKNNVLINDPDNNWVNPKFDFNAFVSTNIQKQLEKLGMEKSNTNADIVVSYAIGIDAENSNNNSQSKEKHNSKKVSESALVIIIVSKKAKKILWVGTAKIENKKRIESASKKRIQYITGELFKNFPN
ncbi:MAG: DUF4136 domain-containing protein [Gammaproteobacteria bacterium]|nr:DUF4136 domain-containing protein [Gammaproteobacteria bacterium]